MRSLLAVLVFAVLAASAGKAAAQSGIPSETYSSDSWPAQPIERTITLPAGMIELGADARGSFAKGNDEFNSQSDLYELAPSVSYGVSDALTIGLTQRTLIYDGYDDSVFGGSTEQQVDPQQLTPSATFRFLGDYDLGIKARLPMRLSDYFVVDLEVMVAGRVALADRRLALRFEAGLALRALTSGEDDSGYSRDTKPAPVGSLELAFRASDTVALGVRTGLYSEPLPGDDDVLVPFLVFVTANINPQLDLLVDAGFPDVANDGADTKQLTLGVRYRL